MITIHKNEVLKWTRNIVRALLIYLMLSGSFMLFWNEFVAQVSTVHTVSFGGALAATLLIVLFVYVPVALCVL